VPKDTDESSNKKLKKEISTVKPESAFLLLYLWATCSADASSHQQHIITGDSPIDLDLGLGIDDIVNEKHAATS
jgi:hypothetical protein